MGFFDKLKKGLTKTRETITEKIEQLVIGYADIDDDLLVGFGAGQKNFVRADRQPPVQFGTGDSSCRQARL